MATTTHPIEQRAQQLEQRDGVLRAEKSISGELFDPGNLSVLGDAMTAVTRALLDVCGGSPQGEVIDESGPYPSRCFVTDSGGVTARCRWIGGVMGDAACCAVVAVIDEVVVRAIFGWAYESTPTLTLVATGKSGASMWQRVRVAFAAHGMTLPRWTAIRRPEWVLLRGVADSYPSCIRRADARIDADLAAKQHAAYASIFVELGIDCNVMSADPAAPDCCFIEDTAVLWDGGGMLTRAAPAARACEVAAVGRYLSRIGYCLDTMTAPASLDGGDVLRAGARMFVGRSGRTNDAGVEALRESAERAGIDVVGVDMRGGLHLKGAATMLDSETVVAYGDAVDRRPFAEAGLEVLAVPEPWGANVLSFGEQVVVSAAARRTAAMIRARGFETISVEISEFHKGDGALSCLSLRIPFAAGWCV